MSHKTGIFAAVLLALAVLLSNPLPTVAQRPGITYYLTIDGAANPPKVQASTLTPQPNVVKTSNGSYQVTFAREIKFLVGTAQGLSLSSGNEKYQQHLLLQATKDKDDPRIWYITTVQLRSYIPGSYYFEGVDTTFSLIVRVQ